MRALSTFALAACLVMVAGAARAQSVDPEAELQMLARINAMRSATGLGTLSRDPRLDAAALQQSADMAANNYLDHVSPRTGDPGTRVRTTGLQAARVAENVALNASVMEAHQALVQSDAHRANLLDPQMTRIGIASVRGASGVYVTQVLAAVSDAPAAPAVPAVPEVPAVPVAPATPDTLVPSVVEPPVAPPAAAMIPATIEPGTVQAGPIPSAPQQAVPQQQAYPQQAYPQPQGAPGGVAVPPQAPGQRRVVGYWVFSTGRWWFYPLPADARPGQVLSYDPNVTGGPPGYNGQAPQRTAPMVQPPPQYGAPQYAPPPPPYAPPPPFGWSPRRQYQNWMWR